MDRVHGDTRPPRGVKLSALNKRFEGDWDDLTWDEIRHRLFAEYLASADQPSRLRIGRGATVARPEAEAYGHKIFAKALYAVGDYERVPWAAQLSFVARKAASRNAQSNFDSSFRR